MRKLMTVAVLVALLAVFTDPAMAQFGDPLTLAASGVLIPFFGTGNNISILEISSPAVANPNLHMIFYNATCTRGESFAAALTENDVELLTVSSSGLGSIISNVDGLAAIADLTAGGVNLAPLSTAIHTRMYWINVQSGRFRVLEPILVDTADGVTLANWLPLRTGATFYAPQESAGGLQTTLYLICPRDTIQGAADSAFPFPSFPQPSASSTPVFKSSYASGSLRARVYDDDENFLRDWRSDCDCLQTKTLSGPGAVSSIYITANTFTELETDGTFAGFTGYKALNYGPIANLDFFSRLSNSNLQMLRGTFAPVTR